LNAKKKRRLAFVAALLAVGAAVAGVIIAARTASVKSDYGNSYLSNNRLDITPIDGLLVLFPAFLLHSGLPYKGERDRVVIAFNSRSYLVQA